MWSFYTLCHTTVTYASKRTSIHDVYSALLTEFQYAVYSFLHSTHSKPIFFGIVYYTQEFLPHFHFHNFKTVPYITVSLQKQKRSELEDFYKEEDRWLVNGNEIYEASKIIEFLDKRLGTSTKLQYPFSVVIQRNLVFMGIVFGLMWAMKFIRQLLLMPQVWFAGAITTFFICTGGIVYSIIHGVPWFKFDRDEFGKVFISEYFMRGQRGQWAGEGYIVSFLVVMSGLGFIFLMRIQDYFKDSLKQRMAILGGIMVIYLLNQGILICYQIKSPWYGPTFMPPAHYMRGPLMNDQGNNI